MDIINKIQLYVSTPEADMVREAWDRKCSYCNEECHPCRFDEFHTTEYADKGYPIVCVECIDEVEAKFDAKKEKAMEDFLREKIAEDKIRLVELCEENDIPKYVGELGIDGVSGDISWISGIDKYEEFINYYHSGRAAREKLKEYAQELQDLATDEGILYEVMMWPRWSVNDILDMNDGKWISDNWDFYED
jgi:hypothetical protein